MKSRWMVSAGIGLALLFMAFLSPETVMSQKAEEEFLDAFEDGENEIGAFAEGEIFDAENTPDQFLKLNPPSRAPIPDPPFVLKDPAIVVSIAGLTCRLYDQAGTMEKVYPVGVGVRRRSDGRTITPIGDFRTHADRNNKWFYIWERYEPEYFAGLPFLRIDAKNGSGQFTYGLHGPITETLLRGYVSHGCIRMRGEDVQEIFAVLYASKPGIPVKIQQDYDYNKSGIKYDVDYPLHHGASESGGEGRARK